MSKEMTKAVLGAVILGGIGGLCLWAGASMSSEKEAMKRWVSTEGTMRTSCVVAKSGGRRGVTSGYGPSVSYDFVLGEETYEGDKLAGGGRYWSANKGEVEGWLAKYPEGGPVTVWYDPDDPKQSVLDRSDYGHSDMGAYVVGWFFVGIAILGLGARIVKSSGSF